ncbi:MAG: class I SAM-dependent methyltransferase [Bacteriovoracaceae bacterium]
MASTLTLELKHQYYYEHERGEILALVPNTARTVLDVGCAAGNLGRSIKAKNPSVILTGIELQQGITQSGIYEQVHIGDVEKIIPDMSLNEQRFDCIICTDVLEHLNDVWKVLEAASNMLMPDGIIIASLPNIRHISIMKQLVLHGMWEYEKEGIMDKTHLRFFTERSVKKVFEDSGLDVRSIQFKEYLPTQAVKLFIVGIIKRIRIFRDLFAFQLIVVATKRK